MVDCGKGERRQLTNVWDCREPASGVRSALAMRLMPASIAATAVISAVRAAIRPVIAQKDPRILRWP
jgi:hypothetical protein